MIPSNEIIGIVYLHLTGIGVLGNSFLLYLHSINFINGHKIKPVNIIIIHLAFTNIMALLFRGIPNILKVWGVTCGIPIITYFQAVTRNLTLSSICLLSGFQATTISPNSRTWVKLKTIVPKWTVPCCLLCWIINLLLEVALLMHLRSSKNNLYNKSGCEIGFIILYTINHVIVIWKSAHSSIFIFLMICFSVYMLFILLHHKQQVRNIQSTSLSKKNSSVTRATYAVLFLVATFLFFNAISPFLILYILHLQGIRLTILNDTTLLFLWYPILSPFILIMIDIHNLRTFCFHSGILSSQKAHDEIFY